MTKTFSILTIFLLVLFAFPLLSEQTNVSGDWQMTVKTPRREIKWEVHFDQDRESLTVTMKGPRGNETTGEGTIKDNKIEWAVSRNTPRGEMTLTYSGQVEGETMSGKVQFGNNRSLEWEASRKEG